MRYDIFDIFWRIHIRDPGPGSFFEFLSFGEDMLSNKCPSRWFVDFCLLRIITQEVVDECSRNFWRGRPWDVEQMIYVREYSGSWIQYQFFRLLKILK